MTAALTKALETHDPHWFSAGLDGSYLRTVAGVMYAVLVEKGGNVVAVYRVSPKRMNVREAASWPSSLVEEVMANVRRGSGETV